MMDFILVGLLLVAMVVIVLLQQYFINRRLKDYLKNERDLTTSHFQTNVDSVRHAEGAVRELLRDIKSELKVSSEQGTEHERIRRSQFEMVKTALEEHKHVTKDLLYSTQQLKEVLSNNKLRGQFGEEVAENLLKSIGFVRGQQYQVAETTSTGSRPDFTVLLPDGLKVNIDAKFPMSALLRWQAAESDRDRQVALQEFATDVKEKVKQCAGREYINPADNTADFVIMFVPNEMIFSVIYDQLQDVWESALRHKVVLAGPFSFTAMLRMIYQSYELFSYQQNITEILKYIKQFEGEWTKYSDHIDSFGNAITTLQNKYNELTNARTNQLQRTITKALQSSDHKLEDH